MSSPPVLAKTVHFGTVCLDFFIPRYMVLYGGKIDSHIHKICLKSKKLFTLKNYNTEFDFLYLVCTQHEKLYSSHKASQLHSP